MPICSAVAAQGCPHLFATRVLGVINLGASTFSEIKPPFISHKFRIGELARGDNDFKLPFSQLILRSGFRNCTPKSESLLFIMTWFKTIFQD